jgi:hypothetical protein
MAGQPATEILAGAGQSYGQNKILTYPRDIRRFVKWHLFELQSRENALRLNLKILRDIGNALAGPSATRYDPSGDSLDDRRTKGNAGINKNTGIRTGMSRSLLKLA